jgi:hypothetical protein
MRVFDINDSYFKYKKCLSGITYQYVNQLDDIYEKNLMVGTNYCTYCMYNEFDIINNFMINLYQVDVCSTDNLDITQRYYQIDGANLRTGHRVLLANQTDPKESDIYNVDSRGYLVLSDELVETGKTWRYKAYVKLGRNKGKQFHLINSGSRFPLRGERKYFLDGHSYIIKNFFNYDLKGTGPIIPKLIFTDYEIARISVNQNYDLYNGFYIPELITGDTIDIKYHEGSYLITIDEYTADYICSGVTSATTIYNDFDINSGYETYIETSPSFISNASTYDYVKLEVSGATNIYLKTFIKETGSTYIIISDYIPDTILNDYYTGLTPSTYILTNLMFSKTGYTAINNTLLESFYSKYFDINGSNFLHPIENVNNRYFDYDGLEFVFSGSTYVSNIFTTNNFYINYKLYEHLNEINSYIFNSGYSFLIDFNLATGFTTEYYDGRIDTTIYPSTWGDSKGTLIKVTPSIPSDVNYFKKYTYVNITNLSGETLIVDLVPNEYFVIETQKSYSDTGYTIDGIETIYNIQDISNILYDVYINEETQSNNSYYRIRDDAMRKNICNGYANFISEDPNIVNYTTAILMQDEQNKFILKIYDPENAANGGIPRVPSVITKLNYTITSTSAALQGEVMDEGGSSILQRGIAYSTDNISQNIVSAVTSSIGPYICGVYPLQPNTPYYYKAYAMNEQGTGYGDLYTFKTPISPITGTTVIVTGATVITLSSIPASSSIIVDAEVIDTGNTSLLMRGIVYQTGITSPITDDDGFIYSPENGDVGFYSIDLTGLTSSTLYSYNAFAVNICGTTYGNSGYTTTLT